MTIFYFVLAAVALGILVFIHELGHYFVARWMGMVVETFSIGFGRPLIKWRFQGVDWQIGWIPFGGYVKILGMELGKKEDGKYLEPHEIPNGFFTKPPWRRICVALAGPLANFILAFLIFTAIWMLGGREKPFSDYTQLIGWVDPSSELYTKGVRPGDQLTRYNGKPYKSSKDLLYATMLAGKDVTLEGYHIDYTSGEKTPFSYTVEAYPAPASLEGILTTGISTGARYLIYDQMPDGSPNLLSEGSPMAQSGIAYGDRLIWADGEILFSLKQLNHIINSSQALLTIARGDETFLTRQPRVSTQDLVIPSHIQDELKDWQYEYDLVGKWSDLTVLPYIISSEGYIEAPLNFLDEESERAAFPLHPYSPDLESRLEPRDRIIAVDGTPVSTGYEILGGLQTHEVQLIAQKDGKFTAPISWLIEDQVFQESLNVKEIQELAAKIGVSSGPHVVDDYIRLTPVEPKRIEQFSLSNESKERIERELDRQKREIEAISDTKKRTQALAYLKKSRNQLLLGIYLQDRAVRYNPSPLVLFGSTFVETGQTIKALVTGYLHPKWISGPLGIVQVIQQGWKLGISEALFWIAAISLNLGFLNLLPIPVLDGGYICLGLWEMITKKKLKAKTMERLILPFVILLFGLLIFLTFQDITRLF